MRRTVQPAHAGKTLHLYCDFPFNVPCQQICDDHFKVSSFSKPQHWHHSIPYIYTHIHYLLLADQQFCPWLSSSRLIFPSVETGWSLFCSICQMLPPRLQSIHIARTSKCTLALYSDCLHFFFMFSPKNLMLMYILFPISHWICSLFL